MLEIKAKLKAARSAYKIDVRGTLALTFEQRSAFPAEGRADSGEEVRIVLAAGEVLRGGDLVTASDGRVLEVVAAEEDLLQLEASGATELARLAWRLGSRHVPVEIGDGCLRVAAASSALLEKDGLQARPLRARFEPEFEPHPHDPAHDHGHGEHCDHGHAHHHPPHR